MPPSNLKTGMDATMSRVIPAKTESERDDAIITLDRLIKEALASPGFYGKVGVTVKISDSEVVMIHEVNQRQYKRKRKPM